MGGSYGSMTMERTIPGYHLLENREKRSSGNSPARGFSTAAAGTGVGGFHKLAPPLEKFQNPVSAYYNRVGDCHQTN
jgi:hypothetical protein